MTQRWKPIFSPETVDREAALHEVSPDLRFAQIDKIRGNGIVVGPRGIRRGQTLIEECGLVVSVTQRTRLLGFKYCSVCAAFLGDSCADEVARLLNLVRNSDEENGDDESDDSEDEDGADDDELSNLDAAQIGAALDRIAKLTGFDEHPLWFASPAAAASAAAATTTSTHPLLHRLIQRCYSQTRCDRCHTRAIVKELPQTLEELIAVFRELLSSNSHHNAALDAALELQQLCSTFDEGLRSVVRAVLMLLNEVAGARELLQKKKSKTTRAETSSPSSSSSCSDALSPSRSCRRFLRLPRCGRHRPRFNAIRWRFVFEKMFAKLNRARFVDESATLLLLGKLVRSRFWVRNHNSDRQRNESDLTSSSVLTSAKLIAQRLAKVQAVEQQEQQREARRTEEDAIATALSDRVDAFCACFDEGRVASPSRSDLDNWRRAVRCINTVLSEIRRVFMFDAVPQRKQQQQQQQQHQLSEGQVVPPELPPLCFITLQQMFLLRCCVQNNQHHALIANPIAALLSSNAAAALAMQMRGTDEAKGFGRAVRAVTKLLSHRAVKSSGHSKNDDINHTINNKSLIDASSLFNSTSRLNHSCDPSAGVSPSLERRGASLRVVARHDLKPGTEVRISYIDLDEIERIGIEAAHARLKRNYGFDCDCQSAD